MDLLWADKYRPKSLQELTYNPEVSELLSELGSTKDFPHIIFYGPEGAGKKTRTYAFLAKIYGSHVYKLKQQQKSFKPQHSSTTVEYSIFTSNYHIQITPSDNEHHDRLIIQNVVKQIAGNQNVESKSGKGFKIIVINEADKLSKQAQGALRRTMEKYMKNCRMILVCTHVHKLISPIRSRCLNIRVVAPQKEEIMQCLNEIASRQKIANNQLNSGGQLCKNISQTCQRNLRTAIIQLQLSKFSKNSEGMISPYKKEVKQIMTMIFKEQSPAQMIKIRTKIYDLLVNCIEGQTILKEILDNFIKSSGFSQEVIKEIVHQASEHQKSMIKGTKVLVHIQSFVAVVMHEIIKSRNNSMNIQ